jgi:hypothetical protein
MVIYRRINHHMALLFNCHIYSALHKLVLQEHRPHPSHRKDLAIKRFPCNNNNNNMECTRLGTILRIIPKLVKYTLLHGCIPSRGNRNNKPWWID